MSRRGRRPCKELFGHSTNKFLPSSLHSSPKSLSTLLPIPRSNFPLRREKNYGQRNAHLGRPFVSYVPKKFLARSPPLRDKREGRENSVTSFFRLQLTNSILGTLDSFVRCPHVLHQFALVSKTGCLAFSMQYV